MGAEFNFTTLSADNDKQALEQGNEVIKQAQYDEGHGGYTGSFAEAQGCQVVKNDDLEGADAEEWLDERAEKWGPALIVKAKDGRYYMGALCSS